MSTSLHLCDSATHPPQCWRAPKDSLCLCQARSIQLHGMCCAPALWHRLGTHNTHSTLHTNLNRLITSRLPLGLPPHTTDSALYATGLLHFAHIYLTFESLWSDLIRDHARPTSPSASVIDRALSSSPTSPLLSYLLVNPYDSPSLFTSTLGAPTPPSPRVASFLSD